MSRLQTWWAVQPKPCGEMTQNGPESPGAVLVINERVEALECRHLSARGPPTADVIESVRPGMGVEGRPRAAHPSRPGVRARWPPPGRTLRINGQFQPPKSPPIRHSHGTHLAECSPLAPARHPPAPRKTPMSGRDPRQLKRCAVSGRSQEVRSVSRWRLPRADWRDLVPAWSRAPIYLSKQSRPFGRGYSMPWLSFASREIRGHSAMQSVSSEVLRWSWPPR